MKHKFTKLSATHKFNQPNEQGQVPNHCVSFSHCGKHCNDEKDCIVLKEKKDCEHYRKGITYSN